jgi:hypothetical protein
MTFELPGAVEAGSLGIQRVALHGPLNEGATGVRDVASPRALPAEDSKRWAEIKGVFTGDGSVRPGGLTPDTVAAVNDITKILQLQTELQRYQLRVEVVSKVSECAVATMRKLQQQQ